MPRVSVIIPTYNRAGFIGEAIQSVLDQTCTDWELIVVDDGSTDETAQVVAQFGERVTYVYQDNAGVSAARNAGLATARGELVSFLDSDDRMLPHNLETLVVLLDAQPKVSVAYGRYYWMNENGQPIGDPDGPTLEGQILPQLVLEETMFIGTALIRRGCVEAIGGFDETVQFQEHWDFYLRLSKPDGAHRPGWPPALGR
jgi:glycosyltransferase involved in cell wall biosynthesis